MKFKDKEEALRRLEAELLQEEETPEEEYDEEAYDEEYDKDEAYEEEYDEEEYDEEEYDEEDSEEDWEEEAPRRLPGWMAGRVKVYNTDALEADLDEYSQKVYRSRSRGRWVAAVALILLAALLLVLAFFAARNGRL